MLLAAFGLLPVAMASTAAASCVTPGSTDVSRGIDIGQCLASMYSLEEVTAEADDPCSDINPSKH